MATLTEQQKIDVLVEALEKCAAGYAMLTTLLGSDQIRQNGKLVSKKALTVETEAGEKCARDAVRAARGA